MLARSHAATHWLTSAIRRDASSSPQARCISRPATASARGPRSARACERRAGALRAARARPQPRRHSGSLPRAYPHPPTLRRSSTRHGSPHRCGGRGCDARRRVPAGRSPPAQKVRRPGIALRSSGDRGPPVILDIVGLASQPICRQTLAHCLALVDEHPAEDRPSLGHECGAHDRQQLRDHR